MSSDLTTAPRELSVSHGSRRSHHQRGRAAPVCNAEHKFATVVFVDVNGSMHLSGSVEPEEWWSVMAGLFELMCEAVDRFGGWVGNFTGDGIKAVFEAAGSPEDHARRACDAALWLREVMNDRGADLGREFGLEVSVRIGMNSGDVLTGTIGGRHNRYFTASGYAVALAKRTEALAQPGRIYLTEHTAALIGRTLELRDLGAFEVKGARRPVGVFELVGRADDHASAGASGKPASAASRSASENSGSSSLPAR